MVELPDPDTFGEPRERRLDDADTEMYHSLFDFEDKSVGDLFGDD
jgi:hypothetical protein